MGTTLLVLKAGEIRSDRSRDIECHQTLGIAGPIREISRLTGPTRNTVKKYLRSNETEPNRERQVSSSKLDPYAEKLATWLGIEATKSPKQRRTLRQIHKEKTKN